MPETAIYSLQKNFIMKTLHQIFEIIENNNISIDNYTEENKLCGYELNTYTRQGVNEILFLDFRSDGNAENPEDLINELESLIFDLDIDEIIETNRQDQNYKDNFSLRQSLEDFENWIEKLSELLELIKA